MMKMNREQLVRGASIVTIAIAVIAPFLSGSLFLLNLLSLMLIFIIFPLHGSSLAIPRQDLLDMLRSSHTEHTRTLSRSGVGVTRLYYDLSRAL